MKLGENIYHYRTQKNLSQGELADALEVSRQSVSKWENNAAVPELEKLMKMARIFELTLDELVTGEERGEAAPPAQEPAPAPYPAAPPAGWEGRRIIGTILFSLGLLLALVCLIMGIVTGNRYAQDLIAVALLVGLPLAVLGGICLLVKAHTLLVCGWFVYGAIWFISLIIAREEFDPLFLIFTILLMGVGVSLAAGTLLQLWKGSLCDSLLVKILLTALVLLILGLSCLGFWRPAAGKTTITPAQSEPYEILPSNEGRTAMRRGEPVILCR